MTSFETESLQSSGENLIKLPSLAQNFYLIFPPKSNRRFKSLKGRLLLYSNTVITFKFSQLEQMCCDGLKNLPLQIQMYIKSDKVPIDRRGADSWRVRRGIMCMCVCVCVDRRIEWRGLWCVFVCHNRQRGSSPGSHTALSYHSEIRNTHVKPARACCNNAPASSPDPLNPCSTPSFDMLTHTHTRIEF